jgi:hypothetical protein
VLEKLPRDSIDLFFGTTRSRLLFDGLHASTLDVTPYGPFGSGERAGDGAVRRLVPRFEYDARMITQHDFNSACLINAATRAIHVPDANGYPLDGIGKLAELRAQFPPDVLALGSGEMRAQHANMRGNRDSRSAPRGALHASRQPAG